MSFKKGDPMDVVAAGLENADSLRGLADFHDEQATSLERDSHLDALDWDPSSKAAERTQAIKAHRAKARSLRAQADQLRKA